MMVAPVTHAIFKIVVYCPNYLEFKVNEKSYCSQCSKTLCIESDAEGI